MAVKVPAPRAAEIEIRSIGCGYDISNDLRCCKGSHLIKIDEEIVLPRQITLSNVSKSIKCDVLSFQQTSEQFNQEISLTGEIPSVHFNAMYDLSGCWQKDATNTKTLAFDGFYTVALEKSQIVLCDRVREAVPESWDPAALASFIETFGTHIIVGVKMKQQHSSTLQPADVQKKLKDMADKRFTNGQCSTSSQHMFESDKFEIREQQLWCSGVINECLNTYLVRNEWLQTVQSESDVISMSFIPITSLLNGVLGCAILCQAIHLYLRFKPPTVGLLQFLESQTTTQPAPVFSDLINSQVSRGKQLKLNEGSASAWSNLPEDVAVKILHNLGPKDRVRFGVVCKDWSKTKSLIPEILSRTKSLIPEMNLPWLLSMEEESCGNSFCPEKYLIYNPWGREIFPMTREFSSEYEVWVVKSTWILLESESSFSYYNPYSKKIVEVPPLWVSNETRRYKATFTVSDTAEFHFFLIEDDRSSNGVIVRVRSNCAEKCSNARVCSNCAEKCLNDCLGDIKFPDILHLVADKEKLFVIFRNRSVGLFSHSDWSILIEAENIPVTLSSNEEPDYVFCDGDLFRVERSWKIYKLNGTEKKWIEYNFGCSDKILFLSRCKFGRTLSRFALMIRTEQSTRNMSGRIYYCKAEDGDEDWCYVYDPNDGARRSFPWPHVPTLFKIWIASPT